MSSPHAGQVLDRRYRLVEPLGRGGMGAVWRAAHLGLGTEVAVKLIDPALAGDAQVLARFRREAQAAASLKSPNVVQILDFGVDLGTPFLVMELLEGESLRACLAKGPLPPSRVRVLATELARGVARAHAAQIIHRDLKPDNVFVARVDGHEVVKVLDFGIAKLGSTLSSDAPLTRTGAAVGTPQYMSPEQIEGRRALDHRTDLWSLALVIFECLCGRATFDADTIGELVLQICVRPLPVPSSVAPVPRGFDAWFARAVDREPERRFESATAMAAALEVILDPVATTSLAPLRTDTPARATSWGGGDERAGFTIAVDAQRRRLEMRLWGVWAMTVARAYEAAWREIQPAMQEAKWRVLADVREFPPQRAEVQEVLIGSRRAAGGRVWRSASVLSSAVAEMQVRRLHREGGIGDDQYRLFTSIEEARAYLDGPDD